MEHTKILMDGTWVNTGSVDEPKWTLMVYPVAIAMDNLSGATRTLMFLTRDDNGYVWKAPLATLLSCAPDPQETTLHNLGQYSCTEGIDWQLYLTIKTPDIKSSVLEAQVKNGYVFLDDIKPKDTDEDLDMWVYNSLKSLTGPRTIHFNKDR